MHETIEVGVRDIWQDGMRKGEVQSKRQVLRCLLEDRFGALPDSLIQQIDAIDDSQRLLAAMRQINFANSLDELQL